MRQFLSHIEAISEFIPKSDPRATRSKDYKNMAVEIVGRTRGIYDKKLEKKTLFLS